LPATREDEALGDREIADGTTRAWADRRNWPELRKLKHAESYGMTIPDFERAADFLDAAAAARPYAATTRFLIVSSDSSLLLQTWPSETGYLLIDHP